MQANAKGLEMRYAADPATFGAIKAAHDFVSAADDPAPRQQTGEPARLLSPENIISKAKTYGI